MNSDRWLIFWLSGVVLDAGTTLVGEMRWKGYEHNLLVDRIGFGWTYVLMAALAVVIVVAVKHYAGNHRRLLHLGLGVVGTSRWVAGTVAGLSLMGVLR